jgi:RNA polymerase sigma-70 factor, ECF subfamily
MDTPAKPALALPLLAWPREESPAALCPSGQEASRLFDIHHKPVFRYVQSFGLATADCEEIVQETFFSLFLHLRKDRPRDNLGGWIFRVAHNLALKCRLRHPATRLVPLEVGGTDLHADPGPGIEQQLLHNERFERLQSVVSALGEQERQCLFLRAEGLRYREIAGVLGVSVGTVSNLLARALAKLRTADSRHA